MGAYYDWYQNIADTMSLSSGHSLSSDNIHVEKVSMEIALLTCEVTGEVEINLLNWSKKAKEIWAYGYDVETQAKSSSAGTKLPSPLK